MNQSYAYFHQFCYAVSSVQELNSLPWSELNEKLNSHQNNLCGYLNISGKQLPKMTEKMHPQRLVEIIINVESENLCNVDLNFEDNYQWEIYFLKRIVEMVKENPMEYFRKGTGLINWNLIQVNLCHKEFSTLKLENLFKKYKNLEI